MEGDQEKLLFVDRAMIGKLKDTRGFFTRLFSSAEFKHLESRFLMVSEAAVYCFELFIDEKDPLQPAKVKLFFRVPFSNFQSITLSRFADNFFILHFKPGSAKDILMCCRRKTEFLAALSWISAKKGITQNIEYKDSDTLIINKKKKTMATLTWVKDENIPRGQDRLVKKKSVNFEIHVPTGIAASQAEEPPTMGSDPSDRKSAAKTKVQSAGARLSNQKAKSNVRGGGGRAKVSTPQPAPVASGTGFVLKALYDFEGADDTQLSFVTGDTIAMLEDEEAGWFTGQLGNKKGYVPANYVEKKAEPKPKPIAKKKVVVPPPKKKVVPPPKKKKSVWEEHTDPDSGDKYYYNPVTEETTWDKPADF